MSGVCVVEAREDCWSVVEFTRAGWVTSIVWPDGTRSVVEVVSIEDSPAPTTPG